MKKIHPIIKYREKHKLSQTEFANMINAKSQIISMIEKYRRPAPIPIAITIEKISNGEIKAIDIVSKKNRDFLKLYISMPS